MGWYCEIVYGFCLVQFSRLLKQEMYYGITYYSFDELKDAIEKYIVYYNEKRIKEKLGWMSPVEYKLSAMAA